jgi:hypothetical protein
MFGGLFLTPFTLGDHNFLIFNPFSMIVNVSDAPREGFKFCFDSQTMKPSPQIQPALN